MFIVWQRSWRRSCQVTLNHSESCHSRRLACRAIHLARPWQAGRVPAARPAADNHVSTELRSCGTPTGADDHPNREGLDIRAIAHRGWLDDAGALSGNTGNTINKPQVFSGFTTCNFHSERLAPAPGAATHSRPGQ